MTCQKLQTPPRPPAPSQPNYHVAPGLPLPVEAGHSQKEPHFPTRAVQGREEAGGSWVPVAMGRRGRENSVDLAPPGCLRWALPFSVSGLPGPRDHRGVLENTRWSADTSQRRAASRHSGPDPLPRPILTTAGDQILARVSASGKRGENPVPLKPCGFEEMAHVAE